MENLPDINSDNNGSRDRLNNIIAVMVAILAAFMAVTKVKDDNIVQAMLQSKSDAVDTWNEYQSKKLKQHLLETSRNQSDALSVGVAPEAAARFREQIAGYEAEIKRYQSEAEALQKR